MTAYVPGTEETDLKKIILSLQQLAAGRSNAVGTVTLTESVATTTVTPMTGTCTVSSVPILVPTTASAATEVGNGTIYISAVANNSFTVTHSTTGTGKTFLYAILG